MIDLNHFASFCQQFPHAEKSIFFGELFLFLREADKAGTEMYLESGTYKGWSAKFIATYTGKQTYTIDRSKHPDLEVLFDLAAPILYIKGDSMQELPAILKATKRPVSILIDGPKEDMALILKDVCLSYPCVKLVAIHDLPPGFGETCHSWDEGYRAEAGNMLDSLIQSSYIDKYPKGPGLGIWINS